MQGASFEHIDVRRCAARPRIAIELRSTTRYDHQLTMAFCPHCGKGVTEQASACAACGQSIGSKTQSARFKGTMMTAGGRLQPPAPAGPVAAPPSIAPQAVSTRNKGTMMGVGLPSVDPMPASPATPRAESPTPPPRPKSTAPPADAIVRRAAASESHALREPAPTATERARRPEGRFVAGPVPPPLVKQGGSRWVAIGLGGMALIATAGYLVAQFLGLIH